MKKSPKAASDRDSEVQAQLGHRLRVADELATNPLVRAGSAEKLGQLRSWKDNFKV